MSRTLITLTIAIAFSHRSAAAADPWPAAPVETAKNIGGSLADFEPSDAVWSPARQSVFIVDDGGDVAELDLNGKVKRIINVGGDLEGITLADPANKHIYVGRERDATIIEIDPDAKPTGRNWQLTEMVTGKKNRRLESLTFVPNAACATITGIDGKPYNNGRGSRFSSGGLFLAGHQGEGRIYIYDLDLEKPGSLTFINRVGPFRDDAMPLIDLAGLCFHRATNTLYAMWDEENRVAAIDVTKPGFAVSKMWQLPAETIDQEGIALIDDGCDSHQSRIVIAEDDKKRHRVWVIDRFPVGPCQANSRPTTQKSD